MRPLKRLIQLDEALEFVTEKAVPIKKTETIPITDAIGRVAAEDVFSKLDVPPFSRAAMDGYAVRAKDTFGASKLKPVRMRVLEEIYAGSVPKTAPRRMECAEIATGAMLPDGADAVVTVEDTEKEGASVTINEAVHPGQNVSRMGEDMSKGTKAISKGDVLNPSKVGALAAIGVKSFRVYSKPLVAVVPTGNEIAPLDKILVPGQVYDINSYTLSSVIALNGGQARRLDIVDDALDDLLKVVRENKDCDMLVFSGGSSVGERDIMLDVIERMGEVIFHGVALKPGKPTLFGMIGKQLVFGMPGYPTSCLSNAYIFLTPALRKMAHLTSRSTGTITARMAKRVVSTTGRTQFLTVRLEGEIAHPAFKESGAITSMAFADGYVIIPADVDLLERGEKVVVHPL
ncbi:MAG: molybdenum cofactor biosynthesis protein [Candidatus Thermoplasmatota archaeon]|nr:molybdenum cofactor biosynthesis protein [Candidatus Thermoplasmatota archaeon]